MRTETAQKLDRLISRENRYVWKRVGATEHLFDVSLTPPLSVAYVVEHAPRKIAWFILGRRPFDGVERKLVNAKAKIEFHFEMLNSET